MYKIFEDYEVKKHSTFKIGGKVKKAAFPEDINDLIKLLNTNEYDYVLGNCSNVLFSSDSIEYRFHCTTVRKRIRNCHQGYAKAISTMDKKQKNSNMKTWC